MIDYKTAKDRLTKPYTKTEAMEDILAFAMLLGMIGIAIVLHDIAGH